MAKGKQGVNPSSAEVTASSSGDGSVKGTIPEKPTQKVAGNPNEMIENANQQSAPPANMVPTALKLEEIDPLLSEQMGKLHQDCMHLALKYMDVASDFRRIGELVGSYKQVIDQKIQATSQQPAKEKQSKKETPPA